MDGMGVPTGGGGGGVTPIVHNANTAKQLLCFVLKTLQSLKNLVTFSPHTLQQRAGAWPLVFAMWFLGSSHPSRRAVCKEYKYALRYTLGHVTLRRSLAH